jgi:hypothetical protein
MFDKYFVKVVRASDNAVIPIPNKYISLTSYVSTPHQRQDLDSYQDNLGKLHRNTLQHTRSKLEWSTPPLTEREIKDLQDIIESAIINAKERKGRVIHYCFDTHTYENGEFYMPDMSFTPLLIEPNGEVLLDKVRLAFIEY